MAWYQRAGIQAQTQYTPHIAVEHFSRALSAASRLEEPAPTTLYRARGLAYETLGEFDQARADHEAALSIARAASDQQGEWQALRDLGALWAGRDYTQTGMYYRQALDLARIMNDPATLGHSLNSMANW